jgi:[ribosomal protein S5]-alanine N-acetyltransferase
MFPQTPKWYSVIDLNETIDGKTEIDNQVRLNKGRLTMAFIISPLYNKSMISTPRLIIKPFTLGDAQNFFELSQDDAFNLFPIKIYRQKDLAGACEWIKTNTTKWAVWENGDLIGVGGLTPWELGEEILIDITYRLRERAHGKGLGFELAQALVNYGFHEMKLSQITATITPDNLPSKRVAEKLGMKFDQHIILLGVPTDVYRLFNPVSHQVN